jgi:hypothetical protein
VGLKNNIADKIEVKIYPNPAKHKCTIEFKENLKKEYKLYILNTEGKTLITKSINSKVTDLDISFLPKGAYLVKLESSGTTVYSQKLIAD